ncbi:pseudouridine synthase [Paraburkholderia edwinii]|uniref:Dual-specificity RNA pseudouridine synthase RluF n=1 Tax=Paraburkholderia edwinii TaxID=2861782 RepID=A0ABX8UG20_9BURK|nr:pseudouridine synthase [Paraburkholderia edwinii]QYD67381.1 pseudouridine synthase [Paraburkholderia edwinii]
MRTKLTAKHPRPASAERTPVRPGSANARKPVVRKAPGKPEGKPGGAAGGKGTFDRARGTGAAPGARSGAAAGAASGGARRAPAPGARDAGDRTAGRGRGDSEGAPRRPFADRAPRSGDAPDRQATRRPRGDSEDAPRRPFADRAPRSGDAPDRQATRRPRGDSEGAPRRPFADRAPRSGDMPDRQATRRPRGDSEGAPRRTFAERAPRSAASAPDGARPRTRGDAEGAPRRPLAERTARGSSSSTAAPRRSEGALGSGKRETRGTRDRDDDRPRRSSGDAPQRRPYGDAPERRSYGDARGANEGRRPARRSDAPYRTSDDRTAASRGTDAPYRSSSARAAPPRERASRDAERPSSPRGRADPRTDPRATGSTSRGSGERTFARPVKGSYAERPERSERDKRPRRATAETGAPRGAKADAPRRGKAETQRAGKAGAPGKSTRKASPSSARAPAADIAERAPHREHADAPGTLRLSKLMSELGLCSRREADEWIEKGWVTVDGERIDTLGTRVRPDVNIEIDPAAEAAQARQVTILLHKPVGYVSGQAEDGYQPAITLVTPANRWEGDRTDIRFSVAHLRQLAPAGRLDIDSTGLLVLTQDGRVAKQLIGGHSEVDKEYLVRVTYGDIETDVEQHFPPESLAQLRHGLELDGVPLKTAQVSWQNGEQLRFVLREGKKRQIRRMCELVGLQVVGLKRVRMGKVALGALPPGQWRYMSVDEMF